MGSKEVRIHLNLSELLLIDPQKLAKFNLTKYLWNFRMLSQEAGRADRNRHYGLYIDGDIAKLPGGMLIEYR